MQQRILILDFGSPYTQLIARRVREFNAYCEIHPANKIPQLDSSYKGVILSGSPLSVHSPGALAADLSQIKGKLPLLGICYGAQYIVQSSGGEVLSPLPRAYDKAFISVKNPSDPLFNGISALTQVWMSYGDEISRIPDNFEAVAADQKKGIAAFRVGGEQTWGVQFHPEIYHSLEGSMLIRNFVVDICRCAQDWTTAAFIETAVKDIREQVGDDKVVLALSGGVDSTVCAVLLNKAIGDRLICIFVDHGLLRKDEFETVLESYKHMGLNVKGIRAADKFLGDLKGVTDPETKRKIIGRDFIEVFDAEAHKLEGVKWLAQGTIYPDIVESVAAEGSASAVKSHHNVGGLPEKMKLGLVEPIKLLFKDEVRRVGRELGLGAMFTGRHPFPGPGLGIRVLGEVTPEKVEILQNADKIYIDALRDAGLYDKVWQAAAILLPVQSVGVVSNDRTYEYALTLRAVNSMDGMTADWVNLPYDFLARVSNEIINNVKGVNRVVYDISSKPPATIEWE